METFAVAPLAPPSKLKMSDACDAGRKFAELFYEKMDKSRHTMASLLHESVQLVWNGNQLLGKPAVVTFFEQLPVSETTLTAVDAHPVLDLPAFNGQPTITVIAGGRQKLGSKTKFFTETFMLTAEASVWKVVADTYRSFE